MTEPTINDIARMKELALGFLKTIGTTEHSDDAIAAVLAPAAADFERAFAGDCAAAARSGYEEAWSTPPVLRAKPGETQVEVAVATPAILASEHLLAHLFPRGYKAIVDKLTPDSFWVAWRFRSADGSRSTRYDGLVWLGGRFVWFPKPYRYFDS